MKDSIRIPGHSKISREIIPEVKFSTVEMLHILKYLLFPLTYIYRFLLVMDRFIKKNRLKKITHNLPPLKIVSIGNITWGGTGKTPFVIKVSQEIYAHIAAGGKRPSKVAVVSRGYRSRKSGTALIEFNKSGDLSSENFYKAGDEPSEIAYALLGSGDNNFVIISGRDRYQALMQGYQRYGARFVIMDDGFQRVDVPRDLDIVCINAMNPFGNKMLIPAGILREPLDCLKRADAIILTNSDMVPAARCLEIKNFLEDLLQNNKKRISVYQTYTRLVGFLKLEPDGDLHPSAPDSFMPLAGFAGLGANEVFKIFIEKNIAPLVSFYSFGDHHWYCPSEIRKIIDQYKGCTIITSRKDIMRILPLVRDRKLILQSDDKIYAVISEIKFATEEEEESWQDLLKKRLSLTETAH